MIKIILRSLLSLTMGCLIFFGVEAVKFSKLIALPASFLSSVAIGAVIAVIFYFFISSLLSNLVIKAMEHFESQLDRMSLKEIVISVVGCITGLIIANIAGLGILRFGVLGTTIVMLLNIVLGYMGIRVARMKMGEVHISALGEEKNGLGGRPKIFDTSVIIDGRILDLLHTGFIEGTIVIPDFVLQELRHIADSADILKRNRGRRGLDILNEIQKQLKVPVEIVEWDIADAQEVDAKLLKMAEKLNGFVVTNDFNLNKVAEFQGVSVLNINELANAIKPVVLPGEDMSVDIIKDGKENGQGIGYLNDGTMIVVEGGYKHIGDTVDVLVTSVLQTAAGRMIFTKAKDEIV